jgi:multidrug efflux pump subunit AcrB
MRLDQKRVVTISGDVSGRLANDVIKEIDARMQQKIDWPRGYAYRFTGEQEEQAKAQAFLSKAFFACIAIILLILLTQFNSFITPLIILTSVILSLIGVFIGLLITGTPFGIIMTGIGVISLAGVVVNNAIVQPASGQRAYFPGCLAARRSGSIPSGDADRHHHHIRTFAHGHRRQL